MEEVFYLQVPHKDIKIVIVTHNGLPHIVTTIESIIENTAYPYKLILIESESTDGTAGVCDWYANKYNHIEVYHTKKEGPMRAINFALEQTAPSHVLLTHDDVIFPKLYKRDWLQEMVVLLDQPKCGAVTVFGGGGRSGPEYLEGLQWLGTWCLLLNRKLINEIGGLDLEFEPGMGDDIDYTYRIVKAGYQIYQAPIWVDHHRMSEHVNENPDEVEKLKVRNAKYFRKKHKLDDSR